MSLADIRSNRCIFVSHCVLAQCVRANGLAKYHSAIVRPVVEFCLENEINIMQMPCAESMCAAGGLGRDPHGKSWYEKNGLRKTANRIASGQVSYMKSLVEQGIEIIAILGMEFSPACGVSLLNRGPVVVKDTGIYIEELQLELAEHEMQIPFYGINQRATKKMPRDLQSLLKAHESRSADNSTYATIVAT